MRRRALLPLAAALLCGVAWLPGRAAAQGDAAEAALGSAVQALLRAHVDEIRACVGDQRPSGEALLDLVAGHQRRVLAARVLKSDPAVAAAAACVAARAQSWQLDGMPVAHGDQIVVPLVFRPDPRPSARVLDVVNHLDLRDGLFALYVIEGKATLEHKRKDALDPGRGAVVGLPATLRCERCRVLAVELPGPSPFLGIHVFGFATLPVLQLPGGRGTVQLGTDGTPAIPLAFDWLELKGGVELPVHQHDGSTEIVFVVAGRGKLQRGAASSVVEPGQLLELPPGTPHGLVTQSPMTAVQFYLPRGPEQRWKP